MHESKWMPAVVSNPVNYVLSLWDKEWGKEELTSHLKYCYVSNQKLN